MLIDAASAPTAVIFDMIAPLSGVIFAACAVIWASGASPAGQGSGPIVAATFGQRLRHDRHDPCFYRRGY
jgi:hypothetical protein